MIAPPSLAERIQATDTADLLPRRLAQERSVMPERLELVEAQPLGDDRWLVLLSGQGALYGAPVIDDGGALRRAVTGDGAAEALIAMLFRGPAEESGVFRWHRFGAAAEAFGERAMLVDQTHESVVVGERAVVKWMIRVEESPAPKLIAHLVANRFGQMPQPWGFVSWTHGGDSTVVASVADFLPGASDGWTWCVQDAGSFSKGETDLAVALRPAAVLGKLVARFHCAISTPSGVFGDPLQQATSLDVAGWLTLARSLLDQAAGSVVGVEGDRLRERRPRIESAISRMEDVGQTAMMPIHGDLHVGQILRWDGGYCLNDFDGNPVLPPPQRALRQSPARDVAGMLQSLDHVGRVVMRRVEGINAARTVEWIEAAQREFFSAYLSGLAEVGKQQLFDQRLLIPFRVEQELREFLYAQNHLPRWRYVPDAAICSMFP